MRMKSVWTLVAPVALVAACVAAGCGGSDESASKESASSAEAATATGSKSDERSEKAGASDKADKPEKSDKPKRSRDRTTKSSAAGDDAKSDDVPASSGDKFGIAACDDYVKTVYDCGNKSQIDMAEKVVIKKWREALADGKSASDVEPMCTKAAGLFKCLKK